MPYCHPSSSVVESITGVHGVDDGDGGDDGDEGEDGDAVVNGGSHRSPRSSTHGSTSSSATGLRQIPMIHRWFSKINGSFASEVCDTIE